MVSEQQDAHPEPFTGYVTRGQTKPGLPLSVPLCVEKQTALLRTEQEQLFPLLLSQDASQASPHTCHPD